MPPAFAQRPTLRIVATDSGLGGLSVTADVVERLRQRSAARAVHVEFFNGRPTEAVGYDRMESEERRLRVFSRALDAMTRVFAPDVILVACNSLSVLYDRTAFAARRQAVPAVLEIVGLGVAQVAGFLRAHPRAPALLFAATTTVQSGVHRRRLEADGIAAGRLWYQECRSLPLTIEEDPEGPKARALVEQAVGAALRRVRDPAAPFAAALLCTHFGFARRLFEQAFAAAGAAGAVLLDPTPRMAETLLAGVPQDAPGAAAVEVAVSSHIPIPPGVRAAMGRCLAARSPATAGALHAYALRPNLFGAD